VVDRETIGVLVTLAVAAFEADGVAIPVLVSDCFTEEDAVVVKDTE
jgi:hypothetical protein